MLEFLMFGVQAHVHFDGDCADAVAFYRDVLEARVHMVTFRETGDPVPPEHLDRIAHATVSVDGASFFLSDTPPGVAYEPGARVHLSVGVQDVATGLRCFQALAEDGVVDAPFKRQRSGDSSGRLTDRFGVRWLVTSAGDTR